MGCPLVSLSAEVNQKYRMSIPEDLLKVYWVKGIHVILLGFYISLSSRQRPQYI